MSTPVLDRAPKIKRAMRAPPTELTRKGMTKANMADYFPMTKAAMG